VQPPAIDPISTDHTAFVGRTLGGPTTLTRVTSFLEFMRIFGDLMDPAESYLPWAVRGFFENGGRHASVARVIGRGTLDYLGDARRPADDVSGLATLDGRDDVNLVVVPDAVRDAALTAAVIDHCEIHRDRVAILALPFDADPARAAPPRDTSHAAMYAPWLRVPDASGKGTVTIPAVGHVAGIYARVDLNEGVHKAPANEAVHGLFTNDPLDPVITKVLADDLALRGINVIRDFRDAGRGVRVWGARTMARDPEWKYVSVRRLLVFLEQSIARGIQWVVFEPNEPRVWTLVRGAIENFLTSCWRSGMLMGSTMKEAAFVTCDQATMTQDDIDNGRLVVRVGVAPLKPAEFVIFRIGLWTADRRDP
jgi:phage tail sheath protein FI